jgi:hypothetical protein
MDNGIMGELDSSGGNVPCKPCNVEINQDTAL